MDYDALVAQVRTLLQQEQRLAYRVLKLRFQLDDEMLEALKDDLIYAKKVAVDEDGSVLVWTGGTADHVGAPLAQPQPPEAERRQLTVLFCDLVDSTYLASQLDPEDYREVVRAYQATCSEVIHRFDGHIAQYLGDGLLVYFGYPQAHEDDAHRAVHTGLGILDGMNALNTQLTQNKGVRLALRLGVHTGLVVVGEIGSGARPEHLALGETPNIAARIQSLAAPDTLVISAATYRLVEGYFACDDLGLSPLKGVATPQQTYRVVGSSGAQSRLDVASSRGLTPLVGREAEVTVLLERWQHAQGGQGQVVLLTGEAGIGKSLLVQVLKAHVASTPHTRWECRSSPYHQNTALYPLTECFHRALHWHQDATPAEKLATLEEYVRQYRVPVEESVLLFAPLLAVALPDGRYPPLTLSPQQQRQQMLATLVAMLRELAAHQPVLFILEDLHWTDPTTLEFLDRLIDHTPTAALCLVLTCRPTFQPPWSPRASLTLVTLPRLAPPQVERLVHQVTGGKRLPREVLYQIVEKTDGVPLFVEEMTKAVLESGMLTEVSGQYALER